MKWNMGWMHDVLDYFSKDPVFRKYHLNQLIFSILYAFSENFMLSLSHDEVVYGKGSLLNKMPEMTGKNLPTCDFCSYMYALQGKNFWFMGDEFGQRREWTMKTAWTGISFIS